MLLKMAGYSPSLFVIVLALSVLISLSPTSSRRLPLHESQAIPSAGDTLPINKAQKVMESLEMREEEFIQGRMDFEINKDYTGSGPNNRHTPNPAVKG